MNDLGDGLLVLGVLGALFVPWLLVATLPFAGGSAHKRGPRQRSHTGEPPP